MSIGQIKPEPTAFDKVQFIVQWMEEEQRWETWKLQARTKEKHVVN